MMNEDVKRLFDEGNSLYNQGLYDEAVDHFTRALEIDGELAGPYVNRGVAYQKMERLKEAEKDFNKALELEPKNTIALRNRANVRNQSGNHEAALADYGRLVEMNPSDVVALKNRGRIFVQLGQWRKAIEDLDKAISIDDQDMEILLMRGVAKADAGDKDAGLQDFTRAVELNPELAEGYYYRAVVLGESGDHSRARADYEKALSINSAFGSAAANLSWLLSTSRDDSVRDGEKALALAQKGVETLPTVHDYDNLAAALAETGDFEEARKAQKKALDLLKHEKGSDLLAGQFQKRLSAYGEKKTVAGIIAVGPIFLLELGCALALYAYGASRARLFFRDQRKIRILNRGAGSIMIGAGIALAVQKN